MIGIQHIKMKPKLIGLFLLMGILPVLLIGFWTSRSGTTALMDKTYAQLESLKRLKAQQLEALFQNCERDMHVLVKDVENKKNAAYQRLTAIQELKQRQLEGYFTQVRQEVGLLARSQEAREALGAYDAFVRQHSDAGPAAYALDFYPFRALYERLAPLFAHVVDTLGYQDVYFIGADGRVVYSAGKQADLGGDLSGGQLKDSGLAELWRKVVQTNAYAVEDFSPYAPAHGEQALFAGAPVGDPQGNGGQAVLAVRIPAKAINTVVQERSGLGASGETYLAAETAGGIALRSDRTVVGGGKYVIGHDLTGSAPAYVKRTLHGEGLEDIFIGSQKEPVAVVSAPLHIPGLHWAMFTRFSLAEALAEQGGGASGGEDYFAAYVKAYGYYDLFLINPDGFIYYTVAKEPDYQTNLVSGPYANTNLGKLFRQVLKDGGFHLADFAPYAPSNGAPAAFIALPLVHAGENELVVALQISLDAINAVMQERTGLGRTGETYLVGPDKRMRSDSYNDPQNRSVSASFAGTIEQNGVDTDAVRQALAGKSGSEVLADYRGQSVLSSYAPVKVGGATWALLAEMDEGEVQAPISGLNRQIILFGAVVAVVIVLVAWLVARSIANPLIRGVRFAEELAVGNCEGSLDVRQKDEVGLLADAMRDVARAERDVAAMTEQLAQGNLDIQVTPRSEQDRMLHSLARMAGRISEVLGEV